MSQRRFDNRAVFITGAGSGIGRATAQVFAGEGASVFAVDVSAEGIQQTLTTLGDGARGEVCDVSSMAAVQASIERAVQTFGGLQILVNAAGVGKSARFEEIDEAEWQRVLGVNLNGPFHTMKAAIPHLLKNGGAIVNISSIAGVRGQAYNAHYCASKAGVLNLTRAIALEYSTRGVRANCVCPGGVKTPLIRNFIPRDDFEAPLLAYYSPPKPHQMGDPEDIARAIAFLASDEARMINGAALVADFGTLA